jgi:hypothetical protein
MIVGVFETKGIAGECSTAKSELSPPSCLTKKKKTHWYCNMTGHINEFKANIFIFSKKEMLHKKDI